MARRGAAALIAIALLAGCSAAPAEPLPTAPPRPWAEPAEPAELDPSRVYAEARLATMTLPQKVASLLMIHVPGTDAGAIRAGIDAVGAAGVIYMGDNVPADVAQLAATSASLSADPDLPVLIGIDQEGGIVRRLPGDTFPWASQLRGAPPEAARDAFASRAAHVDAAGVSMNFGIVADVTGDRGSFIFSRVLGADAASAAPRVAAAVAGEHGVVLSTLKHFPGHGSVPGDSHVSVPTTGMSLEEWRTTQAPPFQAGIDAGAELVMMGHLRYSAVDAAPASLSAVWIGILREELGFDGIVVTDDMLMLENSGEAAYADQASNAVAAVAAGVDLLLFVGPVDAPRVIGAIVAAVESGAIPMSTVDAAALRLLELRRDLSGRSGPFVACTGECLDWVS